MILKTMDTVASHTFITNSYCRINKLTIHRQHFVILCLLQCGYLFVSLINCLCQWSLNGSDGP